MLDLNEIEDRHGILWSFATARYTVAFWAEPEDLDPEDSFEFADDVEFARSGDPAHWFCAFVGVLDNETDECLDYDVLGGCSYKSFREFYSSHRDRDPLNRNCSIMRAERGDNVVICHYFPDMVRQAISAARAHLARNRDGMATAA